MGDDVMMLAAQSIVPSHIYIHKHPPCTGTLCMAGARRNLKLACTFNSMFGMVIMHLPCTSYQ
jgi:hypothetical protein